MRILGIDYGLKKVGLAISDGLLAEPLAVLKVKDINEAVAKIEQILQVQQVESIVIGLSENKSAKLTQEFGKKLRQLVNIPIVFQDETLSTHEAQILSIESGIKRKKRREMEDAYAAAIILQSYLDRNL